MLNYVSGQLHATAALPPGKELSARVEWKAAWTPGTIWTPLSRKKSVAPAGNRTSVVQPEFHATLTTVTVHRTLVEQQFAETRKLNATIIHTRGMQFKLLCGSLSIHSTNTYGGVEIYLHAFLTSAI